MNRRDEEVLGHVVVYLAERMRQSENQDVLQGMLSIEVDQATRAK